MNAALRVFDHVWLPTFTRSGCSWRADQQPWVNGVPMWQVQIDGLGDTRRPGMINRHAVDCPDHGGQL